MLFHNAYTTSAICAPARASVMTGLYPHKHGVIDNYTDIAEGVPLLSECMKEAGYFCGYAGKWHVSPNKTPQDCGFDVSHRFMGDNPALQVQEMFCKHEGPLESTIEYFVADDPRS